MDRSMGSLDPGFRLKMERIILELRTMGVAATVVGTLRSKEEQDHLYAQGRTSSGPIVTHCKGGHSYHNFGLACDLSYSPAFPSWGANLIRSVGELATAAGLSWGGKWKFQDEAHWEDRSRGLLGKSQSREVQP